MRVCFVGCLVSDRLCTPEGSGCYSYHVPVQSGHGSWAWQTHGLVSGLFLGRLSDSVCRLLIFFSIFSFFFAALRLPFYSSLINFLFIFFVKRYIL